jgi:Putative addiction module component.
MSHALPSKEPAFEDLTQEEQIQYIETHLDEIVAGLRADKTISSWDAEMLADRLSRYRWQVENAIPWDELREEFLKD